ncbi:hypothetical protein AWB96_15670 [Mycobacteroides chelonae]|nr:hypothetical protein GR01_07725 [Mycobacteroides chelonae]OLT75164.1 hypothetical protein BKG56_15430 [Mycobacteroides chelonae]ORV12813.1 hypothetical protein AWB96_15670 [Mycobacteroides chelonae]
MIEQASEELCLSFLRSRVWRGPRKRPTNELRLEVRKDRREPVRYVETLMATDHMADLVQNEMLVVKAACALPDKDIVSCLSRDPQPARNRTGTGMG